MTVTVHAPVQQALTQNPEFPFTTMLLAFVALAAAFTLMMQFWLRQR
jgi:hypothetical protein